jgi:dTDP-4-dehydrorhamnose reductase
MNDKPTILILGITGMLGNALFKILSKDKKYQVLGTARNPSALQYFPPSLFKSITTGIHGDDFEGLSSLLASKKPDVVINCIGVVKQKLDAGDVLQTIPLNTLLPHHLAKMTKKIKSRLILISTDCVFSGHQGNYKESDIPDCTDLYGQSKLWGEVTNLKHVLTIRTSIIGHQLASRQGLHQGLLDWFLKQKKVAPGYINTIFSGLPTNELSKVIRDLILPNKELHGLYHVSASPISKYDLLNLIAKIYDKKIKVIEQPEPALDRSLNCEKFMKKTQYRIKDWKTLISQMRTFHLG